MITHEIALNDFHTQVKYGLDTFDASILPSIQPNHIIICGLGGSGIGGKIAKAFFADKAKCPIETVSDYQIPHYANNHTLVILSSYSGNTEETIAMCKMAIAKGCTIIGISSGGEIARIFDQQNAPCFQVPIGYQPRMALGFSLTLVLQILAHYSQYDIATEFKDVLAIYDKKEDLKLIAQHVFESWKQQSNQPILIFADEFFAPVALRFCQQIQENAKGQAFSLELPESNHNAIESIYGSLNANILCLNANQNQRTSLRFDFLRNLLSLNQNLVTDIHIADNSLLELFRIIYITDWISILMADFKQTDKMSVPNIDKLKHYLSTH